VVPLVFDELGLGLTEYCATRVLQPVTGFRTGLIGGRMVETDYGRPVSYGILRHEFDEFLLRRSQARVKEGLAVTRVLRARDGWIVNGIRARVLIGAGGHFCPVARYLNGAPEPADLVAAQEMEFDLDEHPRFTCTVCPEVPLICFCRDLKGYGWCVRKGGHLNLGLGRQDPVQLNRHVMEFVRFLRQRGVIEGELPSPWRGHAYLLRQDASRRLVDDGLLLVGDAAGLAVPGSGEGIRPAIESGLLAAEAILATAGRYQGERLEAAYAGPLRRINPVRSRGPVVRSLLSPLAGTLLSTRWFARHVLLNRGFLQPTRATA
jgi:flavin-dependent dehydrogenase